MKRSTWIAVAVASAVLVLAGQLPRLPWESACSSWRTAAARAVAAWPAREHRPSVSRVAPKPTPAPPAAGAHAATPAHDLAQWRAQLARALDPAGPLAAATAGAAGGLVLLTLLVRIASALWPGRFGRVHRLARAGLGVAEIARHVRMPRDAVRTLLAPAPGPPRAR